MENQGRPYFPFLFSFSLFSYFPLENPRKSCIWQCSIFIICYSSSVYFFIKRFNNKFMVCFIGGYKYIYFFGSNLICKMALGGDKVFGFGR